MTRQQTRKALRKKLKQHRQAQRMRPAPRPTAPWIVASAFVATTALGKSTALYAQTVGSSVTFDTQNPPASGDQRTRRFEIPGGPLGDVLTSFELATGLKVTVPSDAVKAIFSPGVAGVFTDEEALGQVLAGTSLSFRFVSSAQAVSLEFRGPNESIDVTAGATTTVMTSPKYVVPLREIPQTIAVIPQEIIEEQGATTLSEVLRNVPGITLQAGEAGGASSTSGDMFNMRGFNASNSIFVDGVRDDGLVARDVFNLEQVEVFLGPTGSDVGRGTGAGYVNMASKTAHLASASSGDFGVGGADQKRLTVDLNQSLPIGGSGAWLHQSAFRLNALWQDSGVPGRDATSQERRAIAPSLALGLGTPTRVSIGAQVMRQDNLADYGISSASWSEPLTLTTVVAKRPVAQNVYYGSPAYDYDRVSQDSYTARLEHDVRSTLTLRNQTRYNTAHRSAVISSPGAFTPETETVAVLRQGNDRKNTIVSNQTGAVSRFTSGRLSHAATAGAEFTFEEQFAPAITGVGARAPVSVYGPDINDPVTGYAVAPSGASTRGNTDTLAFYAFDTVDAGSRWQFSGGARWEHYSTKYRAIDAAGLVTTDQKAADGLLSGKAGVLFKVTAAGNVYFSVGSTLTPPGTANFTLSAQGNNQNNPNVLPQESRNYEAGGKWDFLNSRLSTSTAVFHTRNKNVIYTVDATAVPPIYNQDDGQLVNGATIGASGWINPRWQVLANITYLKTELQTQNPANNGRQLTLTPPLSGSLWTTYRLPRRLTVGGGARFTDPVFVNTANTIRVPGYGVADALVEYGINEHLTLRLNIYNLTNETYIRNINNNGARYNPGNPRSAIVTSSIRF